MLGIPTIPQEKEANWIFCVNAENKMETSQCQVRQNILRPKKTRKKRGIKMLCLHFSQRISYLMMLSVRVEVVVRNTSPLVC